MATNPFAHGVPIELSTLIATRTSLHGLAEHVIATDLYSYTNRIGLRPTPRGFGTPTFMVDGVTRQIRVDETTLVLRRDEDEYRNELSTLAAAGAFLGIDPGAPVESYQQATDPSLEAPLAVDPQAAAAIAGWFDLGSVALAAFASHLPSGSATAQQLWPEHFDLAITAGPVNYGVSPGDGDHDVPYAYVGPQEIPERTADDPWWNEPWGRSVAATDVDGVEDLVAFFDDGHGRFA